jgi:pimeloyl-ACP methyl ester carboxylesterase
MLLRMMSSMGEGDTILRHPDLFDSLLDAARDPVAVTATQPRRTVAGRVVAEFQSLVSPFGARSATRIRPNDLRRLTAPVLMIWGDHDPVVSVSHAQAAAKWIPDARLEVLPAGRVGQLLDEFARSVSDPPS